MHFRDLRIYQLAVKLRNELHQELKKIPFAWTIGDVDQAKRSSSSVASNIAEGYGRRFYPKDFAKFINYALTSSDETQNHVGALKSDGHLNTVRADYFLNKYKTLSIQTLNYLNSRRKKHNL